MKIFEPLYNLVFKWSQHRHAPKYLAGVSFLESSVFPIPVDMMLMPMAYSTPKQAWKLALITTVMSVLGGLFGYLVGLLAIDFILPILTQLNYVDKFTLAQNWYTEWGFWVTFVAGFSPIPYKVFTIAAGSMQMALIPFIVASLLSRGARFFLVAMLAAKLGPKFEPQIKKYIEWLGWLCVVLVVLLGFYIVKY